MDYIVYLPIDNVPLLSSDTGSTVTNSGVSNFDLSVSVIVVLEDVVVVETVVVVTANHNLNMIRLDC